MQIRPYQNSDLPRLREMTADAFDGVSIDQGIENKFGTINGHDWRWRKGRHVDEDADRDPQGIFVAEENGKIVGCITTWMDHDAGIGHIPNLAFAPEARDKGYGRKLIEFALDRFVEHDLSHARIETLEQNDVGNHLYTSIGFQEVARQVHFAVDLTAGRDTIIIEESPDR